MKATPKLFEQRRLERLRFAENSRFSGQRFVDVQQSFDRNSRELLTSEVTPTIRAKSNTFKLPLDLSLTMRPESQVKRAKRSRSHINALYEFLEDCSLEQYYRLFVDNGIDDLETLKEVSEQHLVSLKLPLAHRLKLLGKLGKHADPWSRPVLREKKTAEQGTNANTEAPVTDSKVSCWKCFKVFPVDTGVAVCNKLFCSEACKMQHIAARTVRCACGASVLKDNASLCKGQWVCRSCLP